jgi:hypothetical protein
MTNSLGLGLSHHYSTIESLRGIFEYYNKDPNPEYQGEEACIVPAQVFFKGQYMSKCTAREKQF